jgi:predicted S18 family serine protease
MKVRKKKNYFVIILSIVLILINIGIILVVPSIFKTEEKKLEKLQFSINQTATNKIFIPLLAVDENGNGKIVKLFVEAKEGKGSVLVNIDNIFFWIDTQESIRTAKEVAEKILNKKINNTDLIYNIESDAKIVGGPSAGAAIAIATIAALSNKTLNPYVAITGTIDENGNIGQVGGIIEKAKAAKDFGIKLLLVPKGQSKYYEPIRKKECKTFQYIEYCIITTELKEINVEKEVGIKVVEVENIKDAIKYFFGNA